MKKNDNENNNLVYETTISVYKNTDQKHEDNIDLIIKEENKQGKNLMRISSNKNFFKINTQDVSINTKRLKLGKNDSNIFIQENNNADKFKKKKQVFNSKAKDNLSKNENNNNSFNEKKNDYYKQNSLEKLYKNSPSKIRKYEKKNSINEDTDVIDGIYDNFQNFNNYKSRNNYINLTNLENNSSNNNPLIDNPSPKNSQWKKNPFRIKYDKILKKKEEMLLNKNIFRSDIYEYNNDNVRESSNINFLGNDSNRLYVIESLQSDTNVNLINYINNSNRN